LFVQRSLVFPAPRERATAGNGSMWQHSPTMGAYLSFVEH
jgi:hypothetical protein